MSEAISATRSFQLIEADVERLERSPSRTHRAWSPDLKARIIQETFAPGANVSAIARSHDLAPSQLFAWRRKALVSPLKSSLIALVKLVDRALRTRRVHGSLRGRSRWIAACWRQMVGSTEVVLVVAEGTAFSGTA